MILLSAAKLRRISDIAINQITDFINFITYQIYRPLFVAYRFVSVYLSISTHIPINFACDILVEYSPQVA